jgi:hypothetical protein
MVDGESRQADPRNSAPLVSARYRHRCINQSERLQWRKFCRPQPAPNLHHHNERDRWRTQPFHLRYSYGQLSRYGNGQIQEKMLDYDLRRWR